MKSNLLILVAIFLFMNCTESEKSMTLPLFVGTYTDGESEGIYRVQFDTETGELSNKTLIAKMENPSFIAFAPGNDFLYSVGESDSYGNSEGAVFAFAVGDTTLQLLNNRNTGGANPCHVAVSEDGKQLAVSNYTGGNLALFTIDETGRINEDKQVIDHKVLDSTRTPHVHKAEFLGNSVFTADLGLDAVKHYVKNESAYTPAAQASLNLASGAGPRHFTFSEDAKFLYVINELNSTMTVFERGTFEQYQEIGTVSTLDENFQEESFCADIHLSKDGKFLYGSNRGENTIVIFKVDGSTGKLTLVGRESVQGDWPRNFTIDPTGNFLLVANKKTNNISVFKRNNEEGTLSFLSKFEMGAPVCLEFMN